MVHVSYAMRYPSAFTCNERSGVFEQSPCVNNISMPSPTFDLLLRHHAPAIPLGHSPANSSGGSARADNVAITSTAIPVRSSFFISSLDGCCSHRAHPLARHALQSPLGCLAGIVAVLPAV